MKIPKLNSQFKRCRLCGSPVIKTTSPITVIKKLTKGIFISVILFTSMLGMCGIYNTIIIGTYGDTDRLLTLGGFYSVAIEFENLLTSNEEKQTLTKIANNLTNGCEDDICKTNKIYQHLVEFKYEEGSNTNALQIWREKEGDCDEMSNLLSSLLRTQGIKSDVVCNSHHCWTMVNLPSGKMQIDLTRQMEFK